MMTTTHDTFKLIMAGNTNVPAMVNVIIRSVLELRANTADDNRTFRQIHVFHTEQSLNALMASNLGWRAALERHSISVASLVHHVTRIEEHSVSQFRELVEQLRTIVSPLESTHFYVDLTGGISSLKTILAVFSYVLDIEHIYSLETHFSSDKEERARQVQMFYDELIACGVSIEYRRFPPIRDFDEFGKLNYTEIIRHKQIVDDLTTTLGLLLPQSFDLHHLKTSLLSGVNFRLMGEVTDDVSNHRHSVFSSSAGVEEIANVLLTFIKRGDIENKTLGTKLSEVKDLLSNSGKYFITEETLEHLTRLMAEVRNGIVHPTPGADTQDKVAAIQSRLSSQLALTFLQFAIRAISSFVDKEGNILDVQVIDPQRDHIEDELYFGLDGDSTGDYFDVAFANHDEVELVNRSKSVRETIKLLANVIKRRTKNTNSILFAEGDNILFKSTYSRSLLSELQHLYTEKTGLHSSIGYGRTLKEATIAMRLAKAKQGDSVVGVVISGMGEGPNH